MPIRKEGRAIRRRNLGPGRVTSIDPARDPQGNLKTPGDIHTPRDLINPADRARTGAVESYIPGQNQTPTPQKGPMGLPGGLVNDLQGLVLGGLGPAGVQTRNTGLGPAPGRPGYPEQVGVGKATPPSSPTGGGGVASPLTEGTVAAPSTLQRTYHAIQNITALDGLFTFEYKAVNNLKMVDAANALVEFNFKNDPAP